MQTKLKSNFDFSAFHHLLAFSFAWCAAFLFGAVCAKEVICVDSVITRLFLYSPISFSGLSFIAGLPLLLSAVCFLLSMHAIPAFIGAGYAFLHGFCLTQLFMSVPSGGWLVCAIVLFSQTCVSAILFYFQVRQIVFHRKYLRQDLLTCGFIACLICAFDYWVISPFLFYLASFF